MTLTLPTSWLSCSTSQLEAICTAQQHSLAVAPELQPSAFKVACFLSLAELEMMEDPQKDDEGNSFVVVRRIPPKDKKNATAGKNDPKSGQKDFILYMWQIQYWIDQYLKWLDTPPQVIHFPYPEWESGGVKFRGPSIWINDWTWQRYRLTQDYLTLFFKMSEKAAASSRTHHFSSGSNTQLLEATSLLLATLYIREVSYIDPDTHLTTHGFRFLPNQPSTNKDYFHTFPQERIPVILMWWSTIVRRLVNLYPKCFPSPTKKEKKKKKTKVQDPMEEYARTTATLEKYMGVNEQELLATSYHVVLQHLNDIITQNEDIERMNTKMKSKK